MTLPLHPSAALRAAATDGAPFLPARGWRVLVSPPLDGAVNMGIDEALFHRAASTGEGVLRVYRWRVPTLSLGRHQRARDAYDPAKARELGVALVRRMTGGRALLHWREVTYSVTAPVGRESLHAAYGRINAVLLDALTSLGVGARIAPRAQRLPPPGSAPCFELPAEGEILVDGRKLVGSAQRRDEAALLQHGSILLADDQHLVARIAAAPAGVAAPAATLADAMGRTPSFDEVATALVDALSARVGGVVAPLDLAALDADVSRHTATFASDEWTWRR